MFYGSNRKVSKAPVILEFLVKRKANSRTSRRSSKTPSKIINERKYLHVENRMNGVKHTTWIRKLGLNSRASMFDQKAKTSSYVFPKWIQWCTITKLEFGIHSVKRGIAFFIIYAEAGKGFSVIYYIICSGNKNISYLDGMISCASYCLNSSSRQFRLFC